MGADRPPTAAPAVLPPLYAGWMDSLLGGAIPAESRATCSSCAMLPAPGAAPEGSGGSDHFFSPDTKCCTYLPQLANFLVGRILGDRDPDPAAAAGRASVEARIDAGLGVTPRGLEKAPVYALLYRSSPGAFGRSTKLLCPHYLPDGGGRCGVWRHRESTCATWFCKHERGETGWLFWRRLHDLLGALESALSVHCLLALDLPAETLERLLPPQAVAPPPGGGGLGPGELEGVADPALQRALWGRWHGRERDFYARCADIVSPLRWPEVLAIGGTGIAMHARLVGEAYRRLLSEEVPARLRGRRLRIVYASPESAHVIGYSPLDPLKVPRTLVDALHCFDGRPTDESTDAVARDHRLRLGPRVLRKLVDFGLLEAAPAPPVEDRSREK
jgi:hypothetical protein